MPDQELEPVEWTTTPVEYYDDTNTTDKIRWVRVGFIFGLCLLVYILAGPLNKPILILSTCAVAMLAGLLILRAWELFILVYLLSAIDHLPMWLTPGMSTFSEPNSIKLVKDILALGLLFAAAKIGPTVVRKKFLVTYTLFGAYFFLRAAVEPGAIALTVVSMRYFLFYPFLGMIFMGAMDSIDKITKFFRITIFAGIAAIIFGIFEIITHHVTYYSGYINFGPIQQRMVSSLGNPNNLAFFLQLPLIYLMSGLFLRVGNTSQLLTLLSVLATGMFLTFSRTSIIMIAIAALCIATMLKNFRAVVITTLLLITGAASIAIVYHGRAATNVLGTRLDLLIQFISESTESIGILLFGRGLGSAEIIKRAGEEAWSPLIATDNSYTDLLRKTGIIGLTLFVVFLGRMTALSIRAGRQITSMRARRLYLTLMTWNIVYMIYAFATPAFTLYPTAIIYWVNMFWILSLPDLDTDRAEGYLSYTDIERDCY